VPDDTCSLEDDRRFDNAAVDGPRPVPVWQAWLEIAVLAVLATAAALIAGLGLPWLALAPLLVGLRYGSGPGVACAAAQVVALLVAARWRFAVDGPGGQAILGWLIAGLVPGQFRDAWTRRFHRVETDARDARQRLRGLARAYHLMAASHDQLQRDIPGSPSSLRDALEAFAREVEVLETIESPDTAAIEPLAERILAMFRAHASVRAATLHLVDANGCVGPAVAVLGAASTRDDDSMIRQAVRLGEVLSVRDLPGSVGTLVAIPLGDITGRVHAVVAVHELPFLSLHQDTLTLFAVLGGHLGDVMARACNASRAVALAQPTRAFCVNVSRSLREARRHGIPAALAIVELEASPGETHVPRLLARCLAAHRRITDDAEIVVGGGRTVRVVILLSLASPAGLQSYLARLEEVARVRAHELGTRCEIRLRGWSLDDSPLPRLPRQLEVGLAALLNNADLPSGTSVSRRRHGLLA
jgi:hypothetical protein